MKKLVLIAFVFACVLPFLQAKAEIFQVYDQLSKCVDTNLARLLKEKNCDSYKKALACNAQMIEAVNHSLATGELPDKARAVVREASEAAEHLKQAGRALGC
jgi:hypothetical protein